MTTQFKMIDLRPITDYLRLYIVRNLKVGIMLLTQKTYISKILERFRIKDLNISIVKKDILIHSDPSYCTDSLTIT